jgi:hypothetical protein
VTICTQKITQLYSFTFAHPFTQNHMQHHPNWFLWNLPWHEQVRTAEVTWRPENTGLHYHQLYISIWEYLRQPPSVTHLKEAREYLATLMEYPNAGQLQRDRIRWTRAWIECLSARAG